MSDEKNVYDETIQQIIDDQVELEGEDVAREQAESAGVELDEEFNVVDYEGSGEEVVEELKYAITGQRSEDEEEDTVGEDERQEYYLDTIRDIVEDQKEFLGPEVALKQARKAPLRIDSEGDVVGFYGKGENALEILQSYVEHQEFYLEAIRQIISSIEDFFGKKLALGYARRAPLEVTPQGEVLAYYGKGRKALEILMERFEEDIGKEAADDRMRAAMREIPEEKRELLPERIRPREEIPGGQGFFSAIRRVFFAAMLGQRAYLF